jgi:hypothetical protein
MESLEDEGARRDTSIAQPEVLDTEHGADRRAGDEVVNDAGFVPVDEQVPDVVPFDDREQPPERAHESITSAKRVVAEREFGIPVEQRWQRLQSPFADGLDVRGHELACIDGHVNLQRV